MKNELISKRGRTALALLLVAVALIAVLFSLPCYHFQSNVFTKKSSNTFVGDEKYNEVRAEVDALVAQLEAEGAAVTVSEEVTERTNSKGETTSLVAWRVSETFARSVWSFAVSGLKSGYVLLAMAACLLLSAGCAVGGYAIAPSVEPRHMSKAVKTLRSASALLALAAMLLIPVFVMMNTYLMSRKLTLYSNGLEVAGIEQLFETLNAFLLGGAADDPASALEGLSFTTGWSVWAAVPCAAVVILSAIELRHGAIKHTLLRGLLYAFVIALCVFTLYPYYVMLITAFRSNAETTDMYFQHLFPTKWEWQNLADIVKRGVPQYMLNSLMVAGGATAIALVCGIPAAYAMARMRFKGKKIFLGFVIMSQMFAPVVLLIGISQLMNTFGLSDSIFGLMLINAAFNQAFAIWLLRGTFVSISPEMEQAARIDGCSTLGSLWHVLLPMAAPGIVTTLIFVFINAWNEYTIATVLISTVSNKPITVGITQFSSFNMIEWQYLFAASLLATIPVVILFMCIEKHLTAGLTSGGVKG